MAKLEDLREWLLDRIDGGEEMRGDDSLISHFINQIDALPSETTPIPASKTQAKRYAAQMEPRGCPTPGACSAVEELADIKQRLLPQYLGRAERAERDRDAAQVAAIAAEGDAAFAEHERDAMLEKLAEALRRERNLQEQWAENKPAQEYKSQLERLQTIHRDRLKELNEARAENERRYDAGEKP